LTTSAPRQSIERDRQLSYPFSGGVIDRVRDCGRNADETHYLRVFMANLRRKLEADSARPRYLLTEQGVCFRFASA